MEDIKMTVAENIKKHRENAGITQRELAEKLDVGLSVISNWENGTNSPNVVKLFGLCQVLGVLPSAIFGMTDSSLQDAYDQADSKARLVVDTVLERNK